LNPTQKKIAILRTDSKIKVSPDFLMKIEEIIVSNFATIDDYEKSVISFKASLKSLKEKKYQSYDFGEAAYLILSEISLFSMREEKNFYDDLIVDYKIKIILNLYVVDVGKEKIIDETKIEFETVSKKSFADLENLFFTNLNNHIEKYVNEIVFFKPQILVSKKKNNFIWFSKGRDADLKVGSFLSYYESDENFIKEHTAVQIVKVYQNSSIGNIIFSNGELPEDCYFIVKSKTNIEILLSGGFSLGNLRENNISINPGANLRFLIPVGMIYFNPIAEIEINFFYRNAKILLPFTFLTDIEGKYNFFRYEIACGFLFGAFFSPNLDYVYKIDCAVIKPYLRNQVTITSLFKIFFEFGYKYHIDDNFSKDWKIDLNGVFFLFGFSFFL